MLVLSPLRRSHADEFEVNLSMPSNQGASQLVTTYMFFYFITVQCRYAYTPSKHHEAKCVLANQIADERKNMQVDKAWNYQTKSRQSRAIDNSKERI